MTPEKYLRRPIAVEAVQWRPANEDENLVTNASEIIDWILASGGTARYHDEGSPEIHIDTFRNTYRARPGDWIIHGIRDSFYPYPNDIFTDTYEPVKRSR
jgi:hypothetical protein